MTDMPERIWASVQRLNGAHWVDHKPVACEATEYVRIDKHDEVQSKLEDALDVINTIRLHFVAHQNNGILLRTHAAFETLGAFLHKYEALPTHDITDDIDMDGVMLPPIDAQPKYIRSDIVAKKISDAENQTVKQVCELYGIDVYQTMIDLDWKVTKDFEE